MRRVGEVMTSCRVMLSFNSISVAFIAISEDRDHSASTVRQNYEVLSMASLSPSISVPPKEPGRQLVNIRNFQTKEKKILQAILLFQSVPFNCVSFRLNVSYVMLRVF
jgi:hypothetical protein